MHGFLKGTHAFEYFLVFYVFAELETAKPSFKAGQQSELLPLLPSLGLSMTKVNVKVVTHRDGL